MPPKQQLPPPLDDPTSPLLSSPPLSWGILGCGRCSHDFCLAMTRHVPNSKIVACASRSGSAASFASTFSIPHSYQTYEELVNDANVEIVYLGAIHTTRREVGEMVLRARKHLFVEKPFACHVDDAEYLIALARENNVFCGEGLWTRFFPAVEQARRLVEEGVIGDVISVQADFCIDAMDNDGESYEEMSFLYNASMGGGCTYNLGPYPLSYTTLFFGGVTPEKVVAVGQVDDGRPNGVDLQASVSLSFPKRKEDPNKADDEERRGPNLAGAGVASLHYGLLSESPEETTVVGTKGRLKICAPSHCPTRAVLQLKARGRGQNCETLVYDYPLPGEEGEAPAVFNDGKEYINPGSAGFAYEAAAVARCVASGKREAPQFHLGETLVHAKIMQEIRSQLGLDN